MKTIGYSNLLMLENIIFTFEYFSIKDVLNILGDYWLIKMIRLTKKRTKFPFGRALTVALSCCLPS